MERNNFASPVEAVRVLVSYGLVTGLLEPEDAVYAANQLFDILKIEPDSGFTITAEEIADAENARQRLEADPDAADRATQAADGSAEDLGSQLEIILRYLLDDAAARGVTGDGVTERDLFDTRLMGVLTPRPAEVVHTFRNLYQKNGAEAATSYFYRLSRNSDYIRTYRVRKDRRWVTATRYGDIDISINLSKPEKDPKAIAAALHKKQDSYPRCLLCPENIGYAGRLDHPARQTIRLIPLTLGGQQWYMQYSPYVYYPEHCIVLSGEHVPMRIDRGTFTRLLEFETKFPHYTIGSNADLPIVGGSILTHEHFQGGRYTFAMAGLWTSRTKSSPRGGGTATRRPTSCQRRTGRRTTRSHRSPGCVKDGLSLTWCSGTTGPRSSIRWAFSTRIRTSITSRRRISGSSR